MRFLGASVVLHCMLMLTALSSLSCVALIASENYTVEIPTYDSLGFIVDISTDVRLSISANTSQVSGGDILARVRVTSSKARWIGVAIGSQMIGSPALIGLDANDAANKQQGFQGVNLYRLASKTGDASKDCVAFPNSLQVNGISNASFTIIAGKAILAFTISLNRSRSTFPLLGSVQGSIVNVAFASGSSASLALHQGFALRSVAFSTTPMGGGRLPLTSGTGQVRQIPLALAFHVSFQILAWIFIIPSGAIIAIARLRRGPRASWKWFRFHFTLQITGVALTFAGWIAGIAHVQSLNTTHFSRSHHVFGYIIGAFALTQVVNGVFMRPQATPSPTMRPSSRRMKWNRVHRILGSILLLNGLTNTIVGGSTVADVFGFGTTLVFPGGSTILVDNFVTMVNAFASLVFVSIFIAAMVDPYRRYRENKQDSQRSPRESITKTVTEPILHEKGDNSNFLLAGHAKPDPQTWAYDNSQSSTSEDTANLTPVPSSNKAIYVREAMEVINGGKSRPSDVFKASNPLSKSNQDRVRALAPRFLDSNNTIKREKPGAGATLGVTGGKKPTAMSIRAIETLI